MNRADCPVAEAERADLALAEAELHGLGVKAEDRNLAGAQLIRAVVLNVLIGRHRLRRRGHRRDRRDRETECDSKDGVALSARHDCLSSVRGSSMPRTLESAGLRVVQGRDGRSVKCATQESPVSAPSTPELSGLENRLRKYEDAGDGDCGD